MSHPQAMQAPVRLKWKQRLRKAFLKGERCRCPFCHAGMEAFRPFGREIPVFREQQIIGGGHRPDAQCPVCHAIDRDRLFLLYMATQTDLFERPQRLLHVAPESRIGEILQRCHHLDYLSADLMAEHVMVKMDLLEIQYGDDSFDVILCNHVMEHIQDDRRAMAELYRVMRPGGWGILQVPLSLRLEQTYEDPAIVDPREREKVYGQSDHVRIYARDYAERLREAGFRVELFRWWEHEQELENAGNRYGLPPGEELYTVHKDRA